MLSHRSFVLPRIASYNCSFPYSDSQPYIICPPHLLFPAHCGPVTLCFLLSITLSPSHTLDLHTYCSSFLSFFIYPALYKSSFFILIISQLKHHSIHQPFLTMSPQIAPICKNLLSLLFIFFIALSKSEFLCLYQCVYSGAFPIKMGMLSFSFHHCIFTIRVRSNTK